MQKEPEGHPGIGRDGLPRGWEWGLGSPQADAGSEGDGGRTREAEFWATVLGLISPPILSMES